MLDKLNITLSSEGKRPDPLTAAELRKIVLEAIEKGHYVGYSESGHARFDNVERIIDINDVLHGLQKQWKLKRTEFNPKEWQWKYTIQTVDVEGEVIGLAIAVDPRNVSFEVLSRWRKEP